MRHFDSLRWLHTELSRVLKSQWFPMQSREPYASLYLWFKRGQLVVAEKKPDGFELADPRRINPGGTVEQNHNLFREALGRVPCLPTEDEQIRLLCDNQEFAK